MSISGVERALVAFAGLRVGPPSAYAIAGLDSKTLVACERARSDASHVMAGSLPPSRMEANFPLHFSGLPADARRLRDSFCLDPAKRFVHVSFVLNEIQLNPIGLDSIQFHRHTRSPAPNLTSQKQPADGEILTPLNNRSSRDFFSRACDELMDWAAGTGAGKFNARSRVIAAPQVGRVQWEPVT